MMPVPTRKKQRLGELLIEKGLINSNQLKDALKKQAQTGGHIGSILTEMGVISTDDLLNCLSQQFETPSANLFKTSISPETIRILPLEKIKSMKVIPIDIDESSITLAMVNPRDTISIRDIEFSLGKEVNAIVVPSSQMEAVIQSLASHPESGISGEILEKEARKAELRKAPPLMSLLKYLASSPVTDMLLTAGVPPSIKQNKDIKRASMEQLTPADCERYAKEILSERSWEDFVNKGDCDLAVTYPDIGRFRINLYRQRNSVSITIRRIADILPSMEELRLPERISKYALMPQGLIVVSGPAGHGKTTTLSVMVDIINTTRRCNIVTLEDPIEYLHKHKKSNVNQRDVGLDTESFYEGLRHVFRQDPDVIVVGEMRDPDSFAIALQAADTGHLVITTVHASGAAQSIERIINIFPTHQQPLIRTRLADSLLFVLSQRLVPRKEGEGRVLAYEWLANSYGLRNLITEGKTSQFKSQMLSGTEEYISLESSLARLHFEGLITYEDGLLFAENKQFFKNQAKAT